LAPRRCSRNQWTSPTASCATCGPASMPTPAAAS
jgi:ribosomal protein L37E